MRIDIADLLKRHGREPEQQPALASPPLGGTRTQRIQRLQVGLSGLVAMVLLVGLANIIKQTAERTESQMVAESVEAPNPVIKMKPASDPLADAGVVPGMPTDNKPKENQPIGQMPQRLDSVAPNAPAPVQ